MLRASIATLLALTIASTATNAHAGLEAETPEKTETPEAAEAPSRRLHREVPRRPPPHRWPRWLRRGAHKVGGVVEPHRAPPARPPRVRRDLRVRRRRARLHDRHRCADGRHLRRRAALASLRRRGRRRHPPLRRRRPRIHLLERSRRAAARPPFVGARAFLGAEIGGKARFHIGLQLSLDDDLTRTRDAYTYQETAWTSPHSADRLAHRRRAPLRHACSRSEPRSTCSARALASAQRRQRRRHLRQRHAAPASSAPARRSRRAAPRTPTAAPPPRSGRAPSPRFARNAPTASRTARACPCPCADRSPRARAAPAPRAGSAESARGDASGTHSIRSDREEMLELRLDVDAAPRARSDASTPSAARREHAVELLRDRRDRVREQPERRRHARRSRASPAARTRPWCAAAARRP